MDLDAMNEHQRRALATPLGPGLEAPPEPTYFHHHEYFQRKVPCGVQLTVDHGPKEEERFGGAVWHCSVSVWPREWSRYPIAPAKWTKKRRTAAEAVARKNLTGVGDGDGEDVYEDGPLAMHVYRRLSAAEDLGGRVRAGEN